MFRYCHILEAKLAEVVHARYDQRAFGKSLANHMNNLQYLVITFWFGSR